MLWKHADILEWTVEEIRSVTLEDDNIGALSTYMIHAWPSTKAKVIKEIHQSWPFRDETLVIDLIVMKDRRMIIPASLQKRALDQPHVNHMGIEKTRLLACKSIYWRNIKSKIEYAIKYFSACLDFQATQPKVRHCHM